MVGLILTALKVAFGMEHSFDVDLWDESSRLLTGLTVIFGDTSWGPLYTGYWFVLSLFRGDALELYYLNMHVLSVLLGVSIFVLLRRLGVSAVVSILAAFFYLISHTNTIVGVRDGNFALLIIIVSLISTTYTDKTTSRYAMLTIGALLASYCRPEYFLSYIACCVLLLIQVIRRGPVREIMNSKVPIGILVALSLVWLTAAGHPLRPERSWVAFGEHYLQNRLKWSGVSSPNERNQGVVVRSSFGEATSIAGAMAANPSELARHALENVKGIPRAGIDALTSDWQRFNWLLASLLGALLLYALIKRSGQSAAGRVPMEPIRYIFLIWLLFSFPGLLSGVVIFPQSRYLLGPAVLLLLALACWAGESPKRLSPWLAAGLVLALYVIAPTYSHPEALARISLTGAPVTEPVRPNRATIQFLRNLRVKKPVKIFSTNGFYYNAYLPGGFHAVSVYSKKADERFLDFIRRTGIDIIVLDSTSHPRSTIVDESYQRFVENVEAYGFSKLVVPQANDRLVVVRKGLSSSSMCRISRDTERKE